MYSIMGDGVMIYSDVSPTESRKADSPKLTLKDNAAGVSGNNSFHRETLGYDNIETYDI